MVNGFHLFTTTELKCIRNDESTAFEAWIFVNKSTSITPKQRHLAGLELLARGVFI